MEEKLFRSSDLIKRYPEPMLTPKDVPYPSSLTFNAGIVKTDTEYLMLFRNDYGCTEEEWQKGKHFAGTNIGLARSRDGLHWTVDAKPVFELSDWNDPEFQRVYDPRVTLLDGRYYVCFAVDTRHGVCGGIFVTDDFTDFKMLSLSAPDNRNMVLFPEKIGGNYVRLERPMPVYSRSREGMFDIWLSESRDMEFWGKTRFVLGTESVPFCNDKIGPGAPPLKTEAGWLVVFHSVDIDPARGKNGWEAAWRKRYSIGVMLLDLRDPSKVIGLCKRPLLVPEASYETSGGFRDNVLFPCGMLREEDGLVRIYYTAGDATVRLATAREEDLIAMCRG